MRKLCRYSGSGSAVEVEDRAVFRLADELAGGAVENFRAKGIGLEEGERGDLEFQSEEFFIEVVLSVEHFCLIALYNICQGIIYNMEESDNLSFHRADQALPARAASDPTLPGLW